MLSLIFGLVAALTWGLHDFLVRGVSQRANVPALLFLAFLSGSIALAPLTLIAGWSGMQGAAVILSLVSGVTYAAGSVGLYQAFSIGPVRLVAPICGAYPVASLVLAATQGRVVSVIEAAAVLAVAGGIAMVARQDDTSKSGDRARAIGWAVLGASGFALTFAFGQAAAQYGASLPATLLTRLTAMTILGLWLVATRTEMLAALAQWRVLILMGALDVTALSLVLAAGNWPHPEYAAVASSVFGLVTILLARVFLAETLRTVQWLGVLVVFGGIATLASG